MPATETPDTIAAANVDMAFDQADSMGGLTYALASYQDNAGDTAAEYGVSYSETMAEFSVLVAERLGKRLAARYAAGENIDTAWKRACKARK